jgi:hypothetical protein
MWRHTSMRSCTLTLQYGTMTIDAEGFVVSPTRYELNLLNLWGRDSGFVLESPVPQSTVDAEPAVQKRRGRPASVRR